MFPPLRINTNGEAQQFQIGDSILIPFTTIEVNLGSSKKSGKFSITSSGLTPGKQVLIYQACGPYTNKGTLADESSMDLIVANAITISASSITVYWQSTTFVKGNFKFNYIISL